MHEEFSYKRLDVGCYRVSADDKIVGSVKKSERWTVRGSPVMWTASCKGRVVGTAVTRKEASILLVGK